MKAQDKKSIINAIQQNLKQMQYEAQQYLDKHHTNLPPICSARHYLFHALSNNGKEDGRASDRKGHRERNEKDLGEKSKLEEKKQEQKSSKFNPKTTIYNLQFTKKFKSDESQTKSMKMPNMNLTLARSRMNGTWRSNRYFDSLSSRTSLETSPQHEKLKTIVLNSEVLEQADKDLNVIPNMFSPKMSKLNLPKKQSDVLQKYLSRFKDESKSTQLPYYQSSQMQQMSKKLTEQQSAKTPIETEQQHCKKRSRVKVYRKTIQTLQLFNSNSNASSNRNRSRRSIKTIDKKTKVNLEQELLKLPKYISLNKKQKKPAEDLAEIQCTPWGHEDKQDEANIYDFS